MARQRHLYFNLGCANPRSDAQKKDFQEGTGCSGESEDDLDGHGGDEELRAGREKKARRAAEAAS